MSDDAKGSNGSPDTGPLLFADVSKRVSAAAALDADGRSADGRSAAAPEQSRALWKVFHDLGVSYRQRRKEIGLSPVPGIRDAARAFRRNPTMSTLVTVASVLHEHGFPATSH
jgi:hypothetical protein